MLLTYSIYVITKRFNNKKVAFFIISVEKYFQQKNFWELGRIFIYQEIILIKIFTLVTLVKKSLLLTSESIKFYNQVNKDFSQHNF